MSRRKTRTAEKRHDLPSILFAKNLRRLRRSQGWTQKALSSFTNINRVSISRLENCRALPDWDTACFLAQALGVTLDEFTRPVMVK